MTALADLVDPPQQPSKGDERLSNPHGEVEKVDRTVALPQPQELPPLPVVTRLTGPIGEPLVERFGKPTQGVRPIVFLSALLFWGRVGRRRLLVGTSLGGARLDRPHVLPVSRLGRRQMVRVVFAIGLGKLDGLLVPMEPLRLLPGIERKVGVLHDEEALAVAIE